MLFNSFPFWGFFLLALLGYFSLPERTSRYFLVAVSLIFYGVWDPRLVTLLLGYTLFNFVTGILIRDCKPRIGRLVLTLAVATNLALLGLFKYYAFVVGNIGELLSLPERFRTLEIILPIGISFYTFEAIAYNVDIHRRAVEPRRRLVDFALFMTFFPRLIAGPIIRPAHFFPQIEHRRWPSAEDLHWSMLQIVKGLLKKVVFADNFALLADTYFNGQAGQGHLLQAWIGILAFTFQIYCDFAGYTDIARGCARLLGMELPPNFERPYLASDIAEFWRRWHISLSSWLRDYLYISLGGNRRGSTRNLINLILTMGLGGLWHGASWNFLIWGLYHGLLLAGHRLWRQFRTEGPGLSYPLGLALTFLAVTIGWVPFRAPDSATTLRVFGDIAGGNLGGAGVPLSFWVLSGGLLLFTLLDRNRRLQRWLSHGHGLLGNFRVACAMAVSLLVLELFSVADLAVPFIYFQF